MKKVVINGFGRIGKNIFRLLFDYYSEIEVVAINDPFSSIESVAYLIKYDSIMGTFNANVAINENVIIVSNEEKKWEIQFIKTDNFICDRYNDSILIDSSSQKRVDLLCENNSHLPAVVLTKWFEKSKRIYLFDNKYIDRYYDNNIISCGICDTVGILPIISRLDFDKISNISIVTLHPFLGYQNVLDGFSRENNHINYPNIQMGRSSINSVIPKKSSVKTIIETLYPELKGHFCFMTYRIPTEVVTVCDIVVSYNEKACKKDIEEFIERLSSELPVIKDPLISRDFYSKIENCYLDLNWSFAENNLLHITAWYNNEMGYSMLVCNAVNNLFNDIVTFSRR